MAFNDKNIVWGEHMLNVCCGTKNPSKLKGIGRAFSEFFKDLKITGIEVSNSVGPQPIGIDETMKGAKTRAELALKFESGCDFGVGVEAGIIKINEDYYNIVASFILDRENNGSFGFSPAFALPHKFVKNLINGKYSELEQIADSYFRTKHRRRYRHNWNFDSRQDYQRGSHLLCCHDVAGSFSKQRIV
jgi:inosine/xanthosine triphosphatase